MHLKSRMREETCLSVLVTTSVSCSGANYVLGWVGLLAPPHREVLSTSSMLLVVKASSRHMLYCL